MASLLVKDGFQQPPQKIPKISNESPPSTLDNPITTCKDGGNSQEPSLPPVNVQLAYGDNWGRHSHTDKLKDGFEMQLLDVQYSMERVNRRLVPIPRLYGVDTGGDSVCIRVNDCHYPYFFVKLRDGEFEIVGDLIDQLSKEICQRKEYSSSIKPILSHRIVYKKDFMGYTPDFGIFLCIHVLWPSLINVAQEILEEGAIQVRCSKDGILQARKFSTFNANIDFLLNMLVEKNMNGCDWIRVSKFNQSKGSRKVTSCQHEVSASIHELFSIQSRKESNFILCSFDIECCTTASSDFCNPLFDQVIAISNILHRMGDPEPFHKNVFVLGSCGKIDGCEVYNFTNEEDLLLKWAEFIKQSDPDFLTGYNIKNFDIFYLIERSKICGEKDVISRYLGRKKDLEDFKLNNIWTPGKGKDKMVNIDGRVILDLYTVIRNDYSLGSNKLHDVALHFLKDGKNDVSYNLIPSLFQTHKGRGEIAKYCLQDSMIVNKILLQESILSHKIEMCRVTGLPFNYLLSYGDQWKAFSMILRKAMKRRYLIPSLNLDQNEDDQAVMVQVGYYDSPVIVLDFSSSYPSFMSQNNICYTTEFHNPSLGVTFVEDRKRKGILPELIEEICRMEKGNSDVHQKQQLQLLLNSISGLPGLKYSKIPRKEIAVYTRKFVERGIASVQNAIMKELDGEVQVIFVGKDSIMLSCKNSSMDEAIKLGKDIVIRVAGPGKKPSIRLAFNKVLSPFLLLGDNRYVGLKYAPDDPINYSRREMKGVGWIDGNDNFPILKETMDEILNQILNERSFVGGLTHVKSVIASLKEQDIEKFVKRCKYADAAENTPARTLVQKRRIRNNEAIPIGTIIPYVITLEGGGLPKTRADDPQYCKEQNIQLDYQYYIDTIVDVMKGIFDPILTNDVKGYLG